LRFITDKLLEPARGSLRAKLEELKGFAVSRLSKIRELLARPENVQEAHAERIGRLTLEATNENGKRTYLAHGRAAAENFGEADGHFRRDAAFSVDELGESGASDTEGSGGLSDGQA